MKFLLVILFFAFSFITRAQIPIIKSNVTDDFKNNSLIYKTFKGKYDLLIAYHLEGSTKFGSTNIRIITLKHKRWTKIIFNYKDKNELDQKITKKRLDKKFCIQLVEKLNQENFWALDNDTINIRRVNYMPQIIKQSKDTIFITANKPVIDIQVHDGAYYFLQILQADNLRVYKTDNPDIYYKYYPQIRQRGNFIRSRDIFLSCFNIN